jgi:hypothetical protein
MKRFRQIIISTREVLAERSWKLKPPTAILMVESLQSCNQTSAKTLMFLTLFLSITVLMKNESSLTTKKKNSST